MRCMPILAVVAACALVGCDNSKTKKTTVDLTFYLAPTITPLVPVDGQTVTVNFTLFNANLLKGEVDNVAWTVSRDGVPDVYTGTVPSIASHQRIPLSFTDTLAAGAHTYVFTVDPANAVDELTKTNNSQTLAVTVLPLVVQ
jgi:hypothetical protein